MPGVLDRLQALAPVIAEIHRTSGTPGASIGVLHNGKLPYTHNYGFRDVEKGYAPDERTIYYIGSLNKSFTAASVGILVDEGNTTWESCVRDVLPEYRHRNKTINDEATIWTT